MNEAQNEALVKESGRQENGTVQGVSSTHEPVYGSKQHPRINCVDCVLRVMRARQRDAYVTLKSGPRRLCPPERITHEALIIHE